MNEDNNNSASLTLGQHLEPEELLLYVLEMLTPYERRVMDEHMDSRSGCARCRESLAEVRHDLGDFAVASVESAALANPPASSRERLLTRIALEAGASGLDQSRPAVAQASVVSPTRPAMGLVPGLVPAGKAVGAPAARARWAGWAGWGVAAALAIAATHFYQDREAIRASLAAQTAQIAQLSADRAQAREVVAALTDLSAQRATLTLTKAAAPPQPSGRATYLAKRGTLIFLASHLDPLPAGKTYELWVIPASGAAPVPAGTFRPDARGNANVVTAKLDGVGAAKVFGITIEPSGGSSTPTMPIVLAGS
jgi:anti-sigma-K factor RskA